MRILNGENKDQANIVSKRGRVLGTVTLSAIIDAMIPPQDNANQ